MALFTRRSYLLQISSNTVKHGLHVCLSSGCVVEHNGRDIDAAPRSILAIVARSGSLIINWFNRGNYHPVHDPSIVHMSRHLTSNGSSPSRQLQYPPPPSLQHQPIGQLLSNYTCNMCNNLEAEMARQPTQSCRVPALTRYPIIHHPRGCRSCYS